MRRSATKYLIFRPRRDFVLDVPGSGTQPRQLLAAGTKTLVRNDVLRHQLQTLWREEVEIISEQLAVDDVSQLIEMFVQTRRARVQRDAAKWAARRIGRRRLMERAKEVSQREGHRLRGAQGFGRCVRAGANRSWFSCRPRGSATASCMPAPSGSWPRLSRRRAWPSPSAAGPPMSLPIWAWRSRLTRYCCPDACCSMRIS